MLFIIYVYMYIYIYVYIYIDIYILCIYIYIYIFFFGGGVYSSRWGPGFGTFLRGLRPPRSASSWHGRLPATPRMEAMGLGFRV